MLAGRSLELESQSFCLPASCCFQNSWWAAVARLRPSSWTVTLVPGASLIPGGRGTFSEMLAVTVAHQPGGPSCPSEHLPILIWDSAAPSTHHQQRHAWQGITGSGGRAAWEQSSENRGRDLAVKAWAARWTRGQRSLLLVLRVAQEAHQDKEPLLLEQRSSGFGHAPGQSPPFSMRK